MYAYHTGGATRDGRDTETSDDVCRPTETIGGTAYRLWAKLIASRHSRSRIRYFRLRAFTPSARCRRRRRRAGTLSARPSLAPPPDYEDGGGGGDDDDGVIDRKSGNKRAANYFPATSTTHKRLDLNALSTTKSVRPPHLSAGPAVLGLPHFEIK